MKNVICLLTAESEQKKGRGGHNVIKISCLNGEKIFFKNISDAAKDIQISAPALRRRILTQVHVNNYHWTFDKTACHYN